MMMYVIEFVMWDFSGRLRLLFIKLIVVTMIKYNDKVLAVFVFIRVLVMPKLRGT